MATHPSDLPGKFIKAREVISGTIYQLLYGTHPTLNLTSNSTSANAKVDVLALTAANNLPAKLRSVVDVVGYWVSGGGLGCKPAQRRWPRWNGSTLKKNDGASKID